MCWRIKYTFSASTKYAEPTTGKKVDLCAKITENFYSKKLDFIYF
jgi:hypothetical protein